MARNNEVKNPDKLNDIQRAIVTMVADGLSNAEIAERLGKAPRTIETYRLRITRQLNITTIAGLVKYAIRQGWSQL